MTGGSLHTRLVSATQTPRSAAIALAGILDARPRVALGLSAMAAALLVGGMLALVLLAGDASWRLGIDFREYIEAARRWLGGGSFYEPWQLTGAYLVPRWEHEIARLPVLYPPIALLLFVPFAVAPGLAALWWAVPISVVAWVVLSWRPRPWTWPILAFCIFAGDTIWLTVSGNPVLWTTAFLALGTRFGWPAVGVLLKPTVAMFALVGARKRGWWLAAVVLVVLALPFGSLWADYAAAIGNQVGMNALSWLTNVPMMLIPIIAHVGARAPAPVGADARDASFVPASA
jgi:hypothetical protein